MLFTRCHGFDGRAVFATFLSKSKTSVALWEMRFYGSEIYRKHIASLLAGIGDNFCFPLENRSTLDEDERVGV